MPRGCICHIYKQRSAEYFWELRISKICICWALVLGAVNISGLITKCCIINCIIFSTVCFQVQIYSLGTFSRHSSSLQSNRACVWLNDSCLRIGIFRLLLFDKYSFGFCHWQVFLFFFSFGAFRNIQLRWSLSVAMPCPPHGISWLHRAGGGGGGSSPLRDATIQLMYN